MAELKPAARARGATSPLSKKGLDYLPAGYGAVTMLEEKLRLSEEQNTALKEEVRSLKMVQVNQGKALEATTDEHKYPDKIA